MKSKFLLLIVPALFLGAGCSTVSETQKPKPVAKVVKPRPPVAQKYPAPMPQPPRVTKKSVPGTATYPIDDGKNTFKVEPTTPSFKAEPLLPPIEGSQPVSPSLMTAPAPAPAPTSVLPSFKVEDVPMPNGTSPAVVALLSEAERNRSAGDLGAAVVATERALRIDSRNPTLTYKLAQLRIKQNKPQLAEELAGKAALLAGADLDLKRKSWLLIAEARRMQNNYQGAKEAKAKSESFFGR